jgi:sugar phosphate isomerase/epimerase
MTTMPSSLAIDDLVLCSGTLGSTPWLDKVDAAARAGFQGVSIYVREYVAAVEAGIPASRLRRAVDERGLRVGEVDGPIRWLPEHGRDRPDRRPLVDVEQFLTIADVLAARSLTVLEPWFVPIASDAELDRAAEGFGQLCDRVAEAGVVAHLEAYPWSGVPDSRTACEIVRRADRPNGGIVVDTWHLWRGPDQGSLDAGIPGATVLGIQLADALEEPVGEVADECVHHRLLPGDGVAGPAMVLAELRRRGCVAPVGVELFSDRLHSMPPGDAAELAFAATQRCVREAAVAMATPSAG